MNREWRPFQYTAYFWRCCKKRYQEDEQRIQHIKALDEQTLRNEVAHSEVSVQLLEDQLRLSATKIEVIRNQAAKFEINIRFLEPSESKALPQRLQHGRSF